jgi:hypothetical protein
MSEFNCRFREFPQPDGRARCVCTRPECAREHGPTKPGRTFAILCDAFKPLLERPIGQPGTELMALIEEVGLKPTAKCKCPQRAQLMDRWGVQGCQVARPTIVGWLKEGFDEVSWREALAAGVRLIRQAEWFRPWDPFGSLIDEAIRRAEARAFHAE